MTTKTDPHALPSKAAIDKALTQVMDPCSIFNRTDLSITDMGLIREVIVSGNAVHVRLLLTDPACLYYFQMAQEIEERLMALDGVKHVTVESTSDKLWSETRMTEEAQSKLTTLRTERLARLDAMRAELEQSRQP